MNNTGEKDGAKLFQRTGKYPNLKLKVIPHEQKQGRVARKSEMTFVKGGLNFNEQTRKELNIHQGGYMQFFVTEDSDNTGIFYATVHKEQVSPNAMRINKSGAKYTRVLLPSAARKMRFLASLKKAAFRCERQADGSKKSVIRLELIK